MTLIFGNENGIPSLPDYIIRYHTHPNFKSDYEKNMPPSFSDILGFINSKNIQVDIIFAPEAIYKVTTSNKTNAKNIIDNVLISLENIYEKDINLNDVKYKWYDLFPDAKTTFSDETYFESVTRSYKNLGVDVIAYEYDDDIDIILNLSIDRDKLKLNLL